MSRQAFLTRLGCQDKCFTVRGETSYDTADVEIPMGTVEGAWWEVQLPPCPDCGGELSWAEAGSVPGARSCACGSTFSVETK